MSRIILGFAAALLCAGQGVAAAPVTTPVTLEAVDGVLVHGLEYQAPHPKAVILLFHQAGSSKAEYATIGPRLASAGYTALAIDQRSGGSLYGPNATVADVGHQGAFLDAQKDLDAALRWGVRQKLPIALWGSSYSASLVFLVAAHHPSEVRAVLAFSPGEYFDDQSLVRKAAGSLRMPIYVTSAAAADEIAAAGIIIDAAPAAIKEHHVPAQGTHGSSTLNAARDPGGAAENWRAMLGFLRRVFG